MLSSLGVINGIWKYKPAGKVYTVVMYFKRTGTITAQKASNPLLTGISCTVTSITTITHYH